MAGHHLIIGFFAGALSALMYGPLSSLHGQLMPWFLFAQLPLLLAGFRYGAMATLVGIISATTIIFNTVSGPAAASFLFLLGLPAWLCARIVWRPSLSAGKGLLMVAGYYLTLLVAGLSFAWGEGRNLIAVTAAEVTPIVHMLIGGKDQVINDAWITILSWSLYGNGAAAFLLLTFINVAIALGFESRRPGWPREPVTMTNLTLPRGWDALFLALVILTLLWQETALRHVALNASIVAGVPHSLIGLAVFHAWVKDYPYRRLLLLAFYALLVVVGWLPLLVLLGLAEEWWRLRDKMSAKSRTIK